MNDKKEILFQRLYTSFYFLLYHLQQQLRRFGKGLFAWESGGRRRDDFVST